MKPTLLALTLLATATAAQAESTRLAYSKAEDVEVFVDHAAAAWCAPDLALRFVYGKPAEAVAVERLMPKIGALLGKQCDQAERLTWTATGSTDARLNGTATKATAWTAQVQNPAAIAAAPAPAPVEPPKAAPAEAPAATAPETAKPATPPAVPEAPAPAAPAAPVAESTPVAPAKVEPAPAPAAKAPAGQIATDFDVAGWRPGDGEAELAKSDFMTTLKDSQGCAFRVPFKVEEDSRYLQVRSSGIRCENGLAQGEGELAVERSDGKQLQRWKGFFLNGLPLDKPLPPLRFVGFDSQKQALFLLASDPATASYSLLRLGYSYRGQWSTSAPDVLFVTGNSEQFRQLDQIRPIIAKTQQQLDNLGTMIPHFTFLAVRDFTKGIFPRPWNSNESSQDFWLYRVNVDRNWRSKAWQFNPEQATNYLFMWDEKQARQREQAAREREREARQARMQQAFRARDQLDTYERLTREARSNPQALLARQVNDVDYAPGSGGDYGDLVRGATHPVRLIARVTKTNSDGWTLDYPYPIQAQVPAGTSAKTGWYVLSGTLQLDPKARDADDLPLTHLTAKVVQPCTSEGCSDLRDPLALARVQFEDPAWTPEAARQQLKDAGLGEERF
ncbi:hypothetical protein [Pseudomonas oryzihabitans]|uniref:Uncharacterized protein n=1 Tax=Pseudomonas oryzihabitans TaxID=47885 RepID=A0A1G5MLK9_9PSED|nr:hypothetical protein [Pseudomonas psychrotolerans]NMY88166.1 hypothetical protein [Pseudomonas psychrotolerans]SCZ25634.1 hypothetical protein SAMN05216279_102209 [Pseudomonas psychrotolerans]